MDCGVGPGALLESAVNAKFKFERWSQSNNDYIWSCMSNNHPLSYKNIVKAKNLEMS